jgi:hypothetical protein
MPRHPAPTNTNSETPSSQSLWTSRRGLVSGTSSAHSRNGTANITIRRDTGNQVAPIAQAVRADTATTSESPPQRPTPG